LSCVTLDLYSCLILPISCRINAGAFIEVQNPSVQTKHTRTAILGSLRYTTAMDGGSAEIAGANTCPYILYIKKACKSKPFLNRANKEN